MPAKLTILIVNGPNLNLLGSRESSIYGQQTLDQVNRQLTEKAAAISELQGSPVFNLEFFQSNHEGEIVDRLQSADCDAVIINPAAYTHTSIAIRDALLARNLPVYEVHISNIKKREDFRSHSYISDIAEGVCFGFGVTGYELALQGCCLKLTQMHSK